MIQVGANVLPKLRRLAERAHHDVDFPIAIEIGERAASGRAGENKAGIFRNVLKRSITYVGEQAVGLLVVGGLKLVDQIVHVGIGGKQILPSIVIEVEKTVAPAAPSSRHL